VTDVPATHGVGSHRVGRGFVRRHRLIAAVALVVVAFMVASSVLFVWPATDQPRHVGAILSLAGGNETAREQTAVSLAEKGYAKVLLFSWGASYPRTCPRVPRVHVVCFQPNPARTIGEVSWAAGFARHHRVHSIMVVAGHAQVTRARVLMKECFPGQIVMVPAPVPLSDLPYEVVYEWGALVKAMLFTRRC
jgi:hypothetical protein